MKTLFKSKRALSLFCFFSLLFFTRCRFLTDAVKNTLSSKPNEKLPKSVSDDIVKDKQKTKQEPISTSTGSGPQVASHMGGGQGPGQTGHALTSVNMGDAQDKTGSGSDP